MASRSSKKKPDLSTLRFEEAMEQLETLIEQIEEGEVGLEESIDAYQRGMGLLKHCRAVLDRAEQQIEQLTAEHDESAEEGDEQAST